MFGHNVPVQRRHISPELQFLTLRLMARTVEIIDSHGFGGLQAALELARDPEPDHGECFFQAFSQRGGGAGVGTLELEGERSEAARARCSRRSLARPGAADA